MRTTDGSHARLRDRSRLRRPGGGEFITGGYEETERICAELGLALDGMGIHYPERHLRPDPGLRREDVVDAAHAVELAACEQPAIPALSLLEATVTDPAIRDLLAARVQSASAHPIDDLAASYLTGVTELLGDDETRRVRGGNQLIAERLERRSHALRPLTRSCRCLAASGRIRRRATRSAARRSDPGPARRRSSMPCAPTTTPPLARRDPDALAGAAADHRARHDHLLAPRPLGLWRLLGPPTHPRRGRAAPPHHRGRSPRLRWRAHRR